MTEHRERRRDQALDFLNAWAGIGVYGRLILTLAIIGGGVWAIHALLS